MMDLVLAGVAVAIAALSAVLYAGGWIDRALVFVGVIWFLIEAPSWAMAAALVVVVAMEGRARRGVA